MAKAKVYIEMCVSVDVDEWAKAFGIELAYPGQAEPVRKDAQSLLSEIAAQGIRDHGMAEVVTINGKMEPTIKPCPACGKATDRGANVCSRCSADDEADGH